MVAIVQAQIGEGGPAVSPRSPARRRSTARAEATLGRLLNQVQTEAASETGEQAETALEVVLGALVPRLTPDEAEDLIAQLPSLPDQSLRTMRGSPRPDSSGATIHRTPAALSYGPAQFVGGSDLDQYARALAAGRLAELPTNHHPHFAPILHPTLETGVETLVVAGGAWLT